MNKLSNHPDRHKDRVSLAIRFPLAVLFIIALISPILADEILLNDGTVIKGKIEEQTTDNIAIIEEKSGKKFILKRSLVKDIRLEPVSSSREDETPGKLTEKYSMKLGLRTPFMFPVGDLSSVLGLGLGAMIYGGAPLYHITDQIIVTGGFDLGFISMSGSGDASRVSLKIIPVLLYAGITYRTDIGLTPYFNLGTGMTAVLLTGDTTNNDIPDGTSVDGSMIAGFGTTYTHPALRGVEFILDISYILAMEKMAGSFLSISLGAAYRFDFGWNGFSSGKEEGKSSARPEIR